MLLGYESSGVNGRGINNFPGYEYLNYGDSDYDARHRLSSSYNYELPIFRSWQDNWACVRPSAAGTSPA